MESIQYFCGTPLFDNEHHLHSVFVVRLMQGCADPLELTYFSSDKFPDACYYCGLEESLYPPPEELKNQYNTVLPLCSFCKTEKKTWYTRRPKPGVPAKKKKQ